MRVAIFEVIADDNLVVGGAESADRASSLIAGCVFHDCLELN